MAAYFNSFPSTLFKNRVATNLITKVRFSEVVRKTGALFYTYTVSEGERPDQIAQSYYGDPQLDWLIYLANDITDPYHDWPKDEATFTTWVAAKYGSLETAMLRTAYYKNNYDDDDRIITTAAYGSLPDATRKYWQSIEDSLGNITSYERRRSDDRSETNAVIRLTGTFGVVTNGTILRQGSTVFGTVAFADSTTIVLKHIVGAWQAATSTFNAVTDTLIDASITSVSTVTDGSGNWAGIPSVEQDYWSPVSCYNHEQEQNDYKKHIRLVHSGYVSKIESDMKEVMS
jgi:hypothetical protein